jgi:hypothetical protein
VSYRPLALVSALTLGDFFLWHWSLNGNHDVLALVSGLTLPPLFVAFLWLLALGVMRLLMISTRRSVPSARSRSARRAADAAALAAQPEPADAPAPASAASKQRSTRIAA